MKKLVVVLISMVLVISVFSFPAFAADNVKTLYSESIDIQPRSIVEVVPDYQYTLYDFDYNMIVEPIVYKEVLVPIGCKLVSSGPETKSVVWDDYYKGTRYAMIVRSEWTHTVVPE